MPQEALGPGSDPTAIASVPRETGKRLPAPAGVLADRCPLPLRRPPGGPTYPTRRPWPPPLEVAAQEVSRENRWKGSTQRSTLYRRPLWVFSWYCSLGLDGWPNEGNVMAAVSGLMEWAADAPTGTGGKDGFVDYQALALHNAAVFCAALPGRSMEILLAREASAALRGLEGAMREVWSALGNGIVRGSSAKPARLIWSGMSLRALSADARARITSLPVPFGGSWVGVRRVLREHGLEAPENSPVDPIVVSVRSVDRLTVVAPRLPGG